MKNCQTYQEQLSCLANGDADSADRSSEIANLVSHATVCPACSHHAISTLLIVQSRRPHKIDDFRALDHQLFQEIDRRERQIKWPMMKAAAILLVTCATFALGRWSTPQTERLVKEFVNQEPLNMPDSIPSIALDHHDYGKGFLAGRTFVIHKKN